MPNRKTMIVEIPMEEGDPLGATPDEKVIIVRIQPQTLADGKLEVGDQLISINKVKIRDRNHFYKLLHYAPPLAAIEIIRTEDAQDEKKAEEAPQQKAEEIPEERKKLIDYRHGYDYLLVRVDKVQGQRFGLSIRGIANRVLVSKVQSGSLCDGKLLPGDHIVDVEGLRVTDMNVAKGEFVSSIEKLGFFTCVVGRPKTDEAKAKADEELSQKNEDPPSVQLSEDVLEIMQQQREREREPQSKNRPSIISPAQPKETRGRVLFHEASNKVYEIGNDNKDKKLRPVRK